jgi:alkyl hydroperoxide reductase subunit AhpF
MSLISPADQERLREEFAKITRPVRLLFFTQTLGCETCHITHQVLHELPPLSDQISIEEVNLVLEGDKAAQYGVDRVPAIAIAYVDGDQVKDTRIRFLGTPAGYEFISLIRAVLLAGGARPPDLSEAALARVAAVDKPTTMQVFTTPT